MKKKLSHAEMRETILKANPGTYLTFMPMATGPLAPGEWAMVSVSKNPSFNLPDELGTYTLKPDMTLPETEGLPGFKQLVIDGHRICFVLSRETFQNLTLRD